MLTILNDPAGITGKRRHPFDYRLTLQQNIERHLSGGADAELRINGTVVDPLKDPRLDRPPGRFDLVTVSLRPRGFDPITWAYIAAGASVVLSLALRPNVPRFDSESSGKDSPNNKLTGQSNVARAYQAIPDVYGYRRVWPDLIQPSTVEYTDQVKYVTEWLCVSRGLGTIEDVRYAETPIADIDGSSFEVFEPAPTPGLYPEESVTTLNDVYEAFASDDVNGQEIPYAQQATVEQDATLTAVSGNSFFTLQFVDGPQFDHLKSLAPSGTAHIVFGYPGPSTFDETCTVQSFSTGSGNVTFTFSSAAWGTSESGTVTVTATPSTAAYVAIGPFTLPIDAQQIWFNTVFLRGLKGSVTIRAEWWRINEIGAEIGGTRQQQDVVFTADTYDQRFYTTKIAPASGVGRYRIQFERRSVQQDANGADVAKLEEAYAVRYFATKPLTGVTVISVTTKATLAATGFSDRKFNLRWTRHVRTLDSETLSASRNFARAMAHIWSIAGNDIAGLDTDKLQQINDEHGIDSPLLRFDGSLDDADMSLGERLQFVANTARCIVWRDGTRWTVTRDQAQAFPEIQLDYRNLAASGASTVSYAAHLPASNDGVEIEYVDEATQVKKAYVQLNISTGEPVAGQSRNPNKIKLLGCATLEQASNRAQLEARRLLYQRVSVQDTALGDAAGIGLGALVRWVDPNEFGGDELQAGEVMAIDGLTIRTSEPLDFNGSGSGRITFTGTDGRRLGTPIECYPADGGALLASLPAGLYVADAERQCGSRYTFAVGLTGAELDAAGLFLTSEIRPAADGTLSLALAAYDSRMYAGDT